MPRLAFQIAIPAVAWRWAILLAGLGSLMASGCVHRRFTVRSNPPGARVFVDDDYEIGTTPVSHDFVYYGTRKIRLVKDGYETLTVLQPMPAPWYEFPGLDFVSENLVPGEIRDHRVLDYQLQPQIIPPTEEIRTRAEELRRSRNPAAGTVVVPGTEPTTGTTFPGTFQPGAVQPGTLPPPPATGPALTSPPTTGATPAYPPPQY